MYSKARVIAGPQNALKRHEILIYMHVCSLPILSFSFA
uniref:Uncharacterized protein n=1 Tax=Anguilla anguilla TaxID=7936 RepID=A0A0E9R0H2_ANGAN